VAEDVRPEVRVERRGAVAIVTIDRPHARNAIGLGTMDELDAAFAGLAGSDAAAAVLTGAGDRAFVAGGDLRELESVRDERFGAEMALRMRAVLDRIADSPFPVIAALNGAALGGGAEVAVACDFRIAAADARIGFTQILLGVTPAWGGLERLTQLVGRARALYLTTTGRVLSAPEAFSFGLVEEVVERAGFEERWLALAGQVASAPRSALGGIKATLAAYQPASHPELAEAAAGRFARAWADPRHWEMAAELERRRKEAKRSEGAS